MSELVVVGEALVDIVEDGNGARAQHPGGSPANVALGLARLGRSVDLLTWLARDQAGAGVVDHLEASGVTVLPASLGASRTSSALARLDAGGGATYEFDLEWHLATAAPVQDVSVLHTGSIAAVADTVPADALLRMIHDARRSATITYDPNLRPSIMGDVEVVLARVEGLVAAADVVKVSEEDLGWLHPDAEPLDVASTWANDLGCALVVVTHGGRGATAVRSHGRHLEVPARPVEIVDTVGAGDAFMGGLLAALHGRGLTGADRRDGLHRADATALEAVLDFASRVAAVTVGRAGANPPYLAEL
ncbi:carbohydrate kinase family protein [Krasilnikoviella flava]|uniref:Fructokinase n=1 Tax=Krasilnikoviella flava TaxID=526729 RepID=A0A1T5LA16_9MICO|nr:carbohydrate kinase [Krasilnikoviella flava]SKC72268.1 fructokinase [Krasilnikoviella flava]